MKTGKLWEKVVILSLVLMSPYTYATNITFDSNGIIGPSDEYWNVTIQDTPPDHTIVDMTGGFVDSIGLLDESTLNISNGDVSTINTYESSRVNAFGGSIHSLDARDTSTINIYSSVQVDSVSTYASGVINMQGGIVDHIGIGASGVLNLSGGSIITRISTVDFGIVNVYGYGLGKTNTGGGYGYGYIYGSWESTNAFTVDFGNSDTYSSVILHEIPEPSTLMFVIGGSLLFRMKVKKL